MTTTLDFTTWRTSIKHNNPGHIDKGEAANVEVLTGALALQNVDADDGEFTHSVEVYGTKPQQSHGNEAAVITTWKRT